MKLLKTLVKVVEKIMQQLINTVKKCQQHQKLTVLISNHIARIKDSHIKIVQVNGYKNKMFVEAPITKDPITITRKPTYLGLARILY
jgi:hypothetical protein